MPVGNNPISPIPLTTLALPAISAATSTSQAEKPVTRGKASPRQTLTMNVAPQASSQAATRCPGLRQAPISPTA